MSTYVCIENIKLPAVKYRKIGQQFIRPYRIFKRYGRLTYKIALPGNIEIHSIVSIAHLESVIDPPADPFIRPRPQLEQPPAVSAEDEERFLIDKLLQKRMIRRRRGTSTEYLVKWSGYGPEEASWVKEKDIDLELVEAHEKGQEHTSLTCLFLAIGNGFSFSISHDFPR